MGAVAEWVTALDWRPVVVGSNPAVATSLWNLGNSIYPALQVSFGGDTRSRRSLLSGIYARGRNISRRSALEMCNLSWTPHSQRRITLKTTLCIILKFDCFRVSKGKEKERKLGSQPKWVFARFPGLTMVPLIIGGAPESTAERY